MIFFTLFKQKYKFCLLLNVYNNNDNDQMITPNIDYIIQIIAMFKKIKKSIESKIICSALIVENSIFEWMIKFALKIYKPIKPVYIYDSEEEAIEKLNVEIEKFKIDEK